MGAKPICKSFILKWPETKQNQNVSRLDVIDHVVKNIDAYFAHFYYFFFEHWGVHSKCPGRGAQHPSGLDELFYTV